MTLGAGRCDVLSGKSLEIAEGGGRPTGRILAGPSGCSDLDRANCMSRDTDWGGQRLEAGGH